MTKARIFGLIWQGQNLNTRPSPSMWQEKGEGPGGSNFFFYIFREIRYMLHLGILSLVPLENGKVIMQVPPI